MFGKQWRKNTLITEADTWNNKEDLNSQTLLAPTKKLCLKNIGGILKSSKYSRRKEIESSQASFNSRFRNMAFKTYLQVLLPITIQHTNEYEAMETKTLEVITTIWRVLTSIDSKSIILAWHPKIDKTLRLLKSIECMKTLTKGCQ